jgi:ankyrin repeat protein
LRWVAVSTDNLPTDAFATAVAVEIGSHCLDPDDIPDEHSILRWCSSLITKDEKLNTLSFSHFTVREFLEDEKLLEIDDLRNFYLDWVDSQTIIAKVCLSYLCMPELSTWVVDSYNDVKNQLDKRPFLNYACKWWTDHTTESKHFEDGTIHDPILFRLICQLFNPAKTNNFILWLHVYWEFSYGKSREIDSDRVVPVPLSASVLHHAAFFGYANVCTWLLEQGADVNLSDPILGTPLLCAIANYHITREGKLNVVKVLLTHGASTRQMQTQHHIFPNYGLPYGTPMLMILDHAKQQPVYACRLFRELLSSNEISNFSTSSFWSNLHGYRGIQPPPPPPPPIVPHSQEFEQPPGAIQRRLTTLEILGRTTEMMAELFRETLNHNASYLLDDESRTKIFTYLLENGKKNTSPEVLSAQITQGNIVDSKISLHIALVAAKNGQTDLIRVFIQEHKDPQVLSNCLPVAAFSGYTEMVDILLEYCLPHVSRTSDNILKAWIRAAVAGNVSCLAAFVKYGVDLNSVVRLYDQPDEGLNCATAISNAVSCGMLEAAKYLCSLPDLHLHVKADGLPLLHLAASASKNRQEMIKLLLKTGADPSERSDKGTTPLHHLLASPYDLNAKDLEAVHSLVKNGCDLEAVDNEGSSLLQYGSHLFSSFVIRRARIHLISCKSLGISVNIHLIEITRAHNRKIYLEKSY